MLVVSHFLQYRLHLLLLLVALQQRVILSIDMLRPLIILVSLLAAVSFGKPSGSDDDGEGSGGWENLLDDAKLPTFTRAGSPEQANREREQVLPLSTAPIDALHPASPKMAPASGDQGRSLSSSPNALHQGSPWSLSNARSRSLQEVSRSHASWLVNIKLRDLERRYVAQPKAILMAYARILRSQMSKVRQTMQDQGDDCNIPNPGKLRERYFNRKKSEPPGLAKMCKLVHDTSDLDLKLKQTYQLLPQEYAQLREGMQQFLNSRAQRLKDQQLNPPASSSLSSAYVPPRSNSVEQTWNDVRSTKARW